MDSGSQVVTARSTAWLGLWIVAFFATVVLTVSGCAGGLNKGRPKPIRPSLTRPTLS
jgi:hypothetical protein